MNPIHGERSSDFRNLSSRHSIDPRRVLAVNRFHRPPPGLEDLRWLERSPSTRLTHPTPGRLHPLTSRTSSHGTTESAVLLLVFAPPWIGIWSWLGDHWPQTRCPRELAKPRKV
jgi:hypothetical protein